MTSSIVTDLMQTWSAPGERWMLFEHGMSTPGSAGGCIEHAHLQAVRIDETCTVVEHLVRSLGAPVELAGLANLATVEGEYLFVTDPGLNRQSVFAVSGLPGQFMRRVLSAQLGLGETWNWRKYPRCGEMHIAISALEGWDES
jgi:hypothetical protein